MPSQKASKSKVSEEEIVDIALPTIAHKTVSGCTYNIVPHVGMTLLCSCGRSSSLSKESILSIMDDLSKADPSTTMKVKVLKQEYNDLPPGTMFIIRANTSGHNYSLFQPLMKVNSQYSLDLGKNYADGMRMGNVPPTEVFKIISVNKSFSDIIPSEFRGYFTIEELS